MSPSVAPPFPFYIINKDIIKGSFPFRKTFLTPKLDFEARFRNPDFARPECSADPKSRNRIPETEQTGGEGRSASRSPISHPRFRPPRVFRRPEEPEQNHGNGTNRRRRTLCQLKPISQPRFHNLDFNRPECSADPKSRNRTTETEQTGGEGRSACRSPISQPDFDHPECSADPKSRNRIPETEQTGGEGRSACRSPISQPRFRPPRVFRRPEEPKQNHGNGTNRRRRKVFQSGEHVNSKIILSLPPKTSKPDSRHHRPVRQKVRF